MLGVHGALPEEQRPGPALRGRPRRGGRPVGRRRAATTWPTPSTTGRSPRSAASGRRRRALPPARSAWPSGSRREVAAADPRIRAVTVTVRKLRPPVPLDLDVGRRADHPPARPSAPRGRRRAFLGLGSNLGDRRAPCGPRSAALPDVVAVSPVYETEPVGGPAGQPPYLNLVVELSHRPVRPGAAGGRPASWRRPPGGCGPSASGPGPSTSTSCWSATWWSTSPTSSSPTPACASAGSCSSRSSDLAPELVPTAGWRGELRSGTSGAVGRLEDDERHPPRGRNVRRRPERRQADVPGPRAPRLRVVDRGDVLRKELDRERAAGRTVGLVPTMGALHRGHAALIRRSAAECDVTAVTIFVNPLQFAAGRGPGPLPPGPGRRPGAGRRAGAAVVFAPPVEEMFPGGTVGHDGPRGRPVRRPGGRQPARPLRRGGHRRRQAVQPGRAVPGLLRREGLPAAGRRAPDGRRPGLAGRGRRLPARSGSTTGWPGPAATATCRPTSGPRPPVLYRALGRGPTPRRAGASATRARSAGCMARDRGRRAPRPPRLRRGGRPRRPSSRSTWSRPAPRSACWWRPGWAAPASSTTSG